MTQKLAIISKQNDSRKEGIDGTPLVETTNNRGPKILPCGIPVDTSMTNDLNPLIATPRCPPLRKALKNFHSLPMIPAFHSLTRSSLWGTESNAFQMSRYNTSAWWLLAVILVTEV